MVFAIVIARKMTETLDMLTSNNNLFLQINITNFIARFREK